MIIFALVNYGIKGKIKIKSYGTFSRERLKMD